MSVRITKVLIIDDHPMIRDSLSRMLNLQPDFEVVAMLDRADDASQVVRDRQPDLVICDLIMPGVDSLQAMRMIRKSFPHVKIVFFSAYSHDRYVQQVLSMKAQGYVLKNETPQQLLVGLRRVAAGDTFYSNEIRERMIISEARSRDGKVLTRLSSLTKREVEILSYVSRGMPNCQIATVGHISPKTVENHCTSIMRKLDIHYRAELALFGAREGFGATEEFDLSRA